MRVLLLLTILFFKPNLISLDLYELDFKEDYLDSGRALINLEFGLHDLEPNSSRIKDFNPTDSRHRLDCGSTFQQNPPPISLKF